MCDAYAFEYPGACHDASGAVTSISGLDSRVAVMEGKPSLNEAIAYCRSQSAPATANACAAKLMRDREQLKYHAQADCLEGTLSTVSTGLPTPQFPQSTWSSAYKFPIPSMCAGDNMQAITIFRILCPSYRGRIEE
jgi:hypothetical protein